MNYTTLISIEELKHKLKNLENEAKVAVKEGNNEIGSQKYLEASDVASELFKMGVSEMTNEVKRLKKEARGLITPEEEVSKEEEVEREVAEEVVVPEKVEVQEEIIPEAKEEKPKPVETKTEEKPSEKE